MPNIAVVCPTCNESFELDDAFAGQACRCAHCGTLMTVPDDPSSQSIQAIAAGSPQGAVGQTGEAELVDEDVLLIGEFLSLLYDTDEPFEVRAPDVGETRGSSKRYAVRGFYDDIDKASRDISRLDSQKRATGIYLTLNPIQKTLLDRAPNQMVKQPNVMTTDKNIVKRKWLPIVMDASRPRAVMCTDTEIDNIFDHVERIADDLSDAGWGDPVQCHGGNSLHLLYPIDLPSKDDGLVKKCLEALDKRYSNEEGKINTKAYRPAYLTPALGTWLREGRNLVNLEDAEDRPHRQTSMTATPMQELKPVSKELLQKLAESADATPSEKGPSKKQPQAKGKRAACKASKGQSDMPAQVDGTDKSTNPEEVYPQVQLFGPVLDEVVSSITMTHGQKFVGLQTGSLPTLDQWTLGLRGLMLLGGAPGVGKTALGIQFGLDVVRQSAKTCFIFVSFEVSLPQIHRRLISAESTMPWRTLMLGAGDDETASEEEGLNWTDAQRERFVQGIDSLRNTGDRIAVIDATNQSTVHTQWLTAVVESVKQTTEAKSAFVVIDNLQAMAHQGSNGQVPQDRVNQTVSDLLHLQRSTGEAILLIDHEHRGMDSLKGQIASAPDCLMFLTQDRSAAKNNEERMVQLSIRKAQDGIYCGKLPLRYYPNCGYFIEDEISPA